MTIAGQQHEPGLLEAALSWWAVDGWTQSDLNLCCA